MFVHQISNSPRLGEVAPGGVWTSAAVVVLVFLAGAVPLIVVDYDRGRGAADQRGFHLPAVMQFAEQWPWFDMRDYPSATSPGFHVAAATVHRWLSDDVRVLRGVSALVTVVFLTCLTVWIGRQSGGWIAAVVCLPLASSLYVFSSGAWLLPDNAGWLGVLGVLIVAVRGKIDGWSYVAGGLILLGLVLVRQSHLWAAAALWAAAWAGTGDRRAEGGAPGGGLEAANRVIAGRPQMHQVTWMALATLPAFLLVGWLVYLWGGFTPPAFQGENATGVLAGTEHQGFSPAAPAMILSIAGVLGLFYLGFLCPRVRERLRDGESVVVYAGAGMAVGLLAAVLPATSYDHAEGRYSGLWNAVGYLPVVEERSLLILVLAGVGGGLLGLWFAALKRPDRWILLAGWVAFTAAQTANAQAWQRYYEPFVLMMLALFTSRVAREEQRSFRWAAAGPAMLAALLAGVTIVSLWRE